MNRLSDKITVITGAGQGIGEAIARAFANEGAIVAILELDAEAGKRVADSINARFPNRALSIVADVASAESVRASLEVVAAQFGRIDVLVNNAGINVFGDPLEITENDWKRCFAVDLEGAWNGCRAVLPGMLQNGKGTIINLASTHSFKIIRGCFPYPVAKHGLIGLTRALGLEYAAKGIRVNAIAPGYIETRLATEYWNTQPDPEAARARTYAINPMGRIGRPEEVAMTAVFLASDEALFINATCITIDGGLQELYHG